MKANMILSIFAMSVLLGKDEHISELKTQPKFRPLSKICPWVESSFLRNTLSVY